MAKLKVIQKFRDKFNEAKQYKVGDEIVINDKKRVAYIVSLGLATIIPEPQRKLSAAANGIDSDETPKRKRNHKKKSK